ncbi:MAG TPA: hypothetical protein VFQ32_11210 [Ktedonobacterales bacterium]|nr:hypothetical protein [Ktedonobacterales bacterium]
MLIDRLQTAVEHLAQLTPEQQEQLAEHIEDILDEAQWDAQFADPRSEAFFDELVEDAQRGPLHPLPTPADLGDPEPEDEGSGGDVRQ